MVIEGQVVLDGPKYRSLVCGGNSCDSLVVENWLAGTGTTVLVIPPGGVGALRFDSYPPFRSADSSFVPLSTSLFAISIWPFIRPLRCLCLLPAGCPRLAK